MKNNRHSEKPSAKYFLIGKNSPFHIHEAYKSVRTNLLSVLAVFGDEPKRLCFTSSAPMDGKTQSCSNIAIVFAEMGAKVLVIDADMRRPKIHRVFKMPVSPGLADCLSGFVDLKDTIVQYKDADGLYIIPSGKLPPNPTELLLSKQFDALLESVKDEFDYVFIDVPPIGVVTDATIISKKTLGAIIVCKSGKTKMEEAVKAKVEIERGGGKVIGSLLNGYDYTIYTKKNKYGYEYGYYETNPGDLESDD